MLRLIEFGCGLLAGVLGLWGIALATLVLPVSTGTTFSDGTTTTTIESGPSILVVFLFLLMPLCVIGVALGAYLHARRGIRRGTHLLWISTALLVIGVGLGIGSLGLFLAPAVLLALAATVAAGAG